MEKIENARMLNKLRNDVIIIKKLGKNIKCQYKTLKYICKALNKHKSNNKKLKHKRIKLFRLYEENKTLHNVFMENNID